MKDGDKLRGVLKKVDGSRSYFDGTLFLVTDLSTCVTC